MANGIPTERFEKIEVTSADVLRRWLETYHHREENVWLVTFKKHVSGKYVSVDQVLDELIAFGWIDGIRRKLDEDRTMQIIGPRRTQAWAKSYKDRAARLIEEGRMRAPGLASIEASKRNGLWEFWADVDALVVPEDLGTALRANARARLEFEASGASYRRNLLRWIKLARTGPTREKRIARIVESAARGERLPQM